MLSLLLLLLDNVSIELASIFSNGVLLVIVNWDLDALLANRFFSSIVELSYIRMFKSLLQRRLDTIEII
jgi:hypothetical protein